MGKRKKPEEIKRLLAEAERDLSRGLSVVDVCRKIGVSEATYHRWRQRFSAARNDETRRVKQLEAESIIRAEQVGIATRQGERLEALPEILCPAPVRRAVIPIGLPTRRRSPPSRARRAAKPS